LLVSGPEFKAWVDRLLKQSGFREAVLRISVHWKTDRNGIFLAMSRAFEGYPRTLYEKGVSVETAVPRRSAPRAWDPQIKASQFVSGVLAVLDNAGRRFYELIFLNQDQSLAEGTVSNIFLVKQKRVLTPSAHSGILRGVTRSFVLSLARKRGLEVCETLLSRHEVYNADECFLTNTSSEILPVVYFDRRKIGEGKPGPATRMLMRDFKDHAKG
jgi:branched-chain amino acid aminotransferase